MWTRFAVVATTTAVLGVLSGGILRFAAFLRLNPGGSGAVLVALLLIVFVGGGIAGVLTWSTGAHSGPRDGRGSPHDRSG